MRGNISAGDLQVPDGFVELGLATPVAWQVEHRVTVFFTVQADLHLERRQSRRVHDRRQRVLDGRTGGGLSRRRSGNEQGPENQTHENTLNT